jgi:hypothetical protein
VASHRGLPLRQFVCPLTMQSMPTAAFTFQNITEGLGASRPFMRFLLGILIAARNIYR